MIPAAVVYIVMTLLLILFGTTDIKNFILGFSAFGIYDMTNLSIFDKFDAKFACIYINQKNYNEKKLDLAKFE